MAKKGMANNVKLGTESPDQSPIVVFGSERIGAIYALRNGLDPKRIRLATAGGDYLRGVSTGVVTVIRVSNEVWYPPTFACEKRVAETEQALKALEKTGTRIETNMLV